MLIEQVSLGKVVRRACSEGYACATQLGVLYGELAEPEAENEYSTYALHVLRLTCKCAPVSDLYVFIRSMDLKTWQANAIAPGLRPRPFSFSFISFLVTSWQMATRS